MYVGVDETGDQIPAPSVHHVGTGGNTDARRRRNVHNPIAGNEYCVVRQQATGLDVHNRGMHNCEIGYQRRCRSGMDGCTAGQKSR